MNPRVTLVMPVYNGEQYLSSAIASALGQDYSNLEIIIVNDGSTDRYTDRIARAFRDANPELITYISQPNGGVSSALNAAIAASTGEFFCWLSHDDLYYSDRISSQIEFHAKIGISDASVFSNFSLIDAAGKSIHGPALEPRIFETNPEISLLHSGINGCTLLIPMAILRRYGPFDITLRSSQDYDVWGRIIQNHPFFYNNNELVRYRVHSQQGTQNSASAREGDELWIRLMENQDPIRRAQMYGSSRRFYEAIGEFLAKSSPYVKATSYARKMMQIENSDLLVTILLRLSEDEADIQRSIESVFAQSHQNWELLLLAPPGTQDVEMFVQSAMDRNRVRLVTTDGDEADHYNSGIDNARGEYIAFIQPGDVWFADRLSKQIDLLVQEGCLVAHASYLDWWRELSSRRVAVIHVEQSVTSANSVLSPIDIAFSTLLVHRAVTAAGLRFERGSPDAIYLFIAGLANIYDWLCISEPIAEVLVDTSSPKIQQVRRSQIEAECRRHIPPSDRLFCSLRLETDLRVAVAARNAYVQSFGDGLDIPCVDFAVPPTRADTGRGSNFTDVPSRVLAPRGYVLLLAHELGGGIQRFLDDRIRQLQAEGYGIYLLRREIDSCKLSESRSLASTIFLNQSATKEGGALFEVLGATGKVIKTFALDLSAGCIADDLMSLDIRWAEIHSLATLKPAIWMPLIHYLTSANISYTIHLHDYMFVCPRLFMVLPTGEYCGAPGIEGCERCIAQHGGVFGKCSVAAWRSLHASLLAEASQVVAPDEDVRQRFQSYFPGLDIDVRPHSSEQDPLRRVLILGNCMVHKGSDILVKVARLALEHSRPIEFLLLGTSDRDDELRALTNVQLLGAYHDSSLKDRILAIQADLVWFPGQAVETFSYTLSAAFDAGAHPIAFDVGAIASRIRASGRGGLLPLWMAKHPERILDKLFTFRAQTLEK